MTCTCDSYQMCDPHANLSQREAIHSLRYEGDRDEYTRKILEELKPSDELSRDNLQDWMNR